MAARNLLDPEKLIALLSAGLVQFAIAGTPPELTPADVLQDYDQVIAQIPGDHARIASVALAELNIALHQAKKQAALTLCQGHWMPSGEVVQQLGPLPVTQSDGGTIWIYQAARHAHPLACEHTSRAQFFQEMSRHLPAWISLRPAGELVTFSQGHVKPPPHPRLAIR